MNLAPVVFPNVDVSVNGTLETIVFKDMIELLLNLILYSYYGSTGRSHKENIRICSSAEKDWQRTW